MPRQQGQLRTVPTPEEAPLGLFEGRPVEQIVIKITKAGDGLSKAMKIDPKLLEISDQTGVLLIGHAEKVTFEPHKYDQDEEDRDGVDRVQVIEAEGAILMPADGKEFAAVRATISAVRKREQAERDTRRKQGSLGLNEAVDGNGSAPE